MVTPPLPDIGSHRNGVGLEVVRSLTNHFIVKWAVEHNERELLQVDLMDLTEDSLPLSWIDSCLFLFIKSIQSMVAVSAKVATHRRQLVACQNPGIVGIIEKVISPLADIKPTRNGSCGW